MRVYLTQTLSFDAESEDELRAAFGAVKHHDIDYLSSLWDDFGLKNAESDHDAYFECPKCGCDVRWQYYTSLAESIDPPQFRCGNGGCRYTPTEPEE
ncbi:MAG TPA: hypothetical protein VM537_35775 [Anaerolineae bacterium]|nr:hypothetical protein [Anaerolineae bacterium]